VTYPWNPKRGRWRAAPNSRCSCTEVLKWRPLLISARARGPQVARARHTCAHTYTHIHSSLRSCRLTKGLSYTHRHAINATHTLWLITLSYGLAANLRRVGTPIVLPASTAAWLAARMSRACGVMTSTGTQVKGAQVHKCTGAQVHRCTSAQVQAQRCRYKCKCNNLEQPATRTACKPTRPLRLICFALLGQVSQCAFLIALQPTLAHDFWAPSSSI